MTEIKVPKKYRLSIRKTDWYKEGYRDAIAGVVKSDSEFEDLVRHQGSGIAQAYLEGHKKGEKAMGFRNYLKSLLERELTDDKYQMAALNNELRSAIHRAEFAIANTHSAEKMKELEELNLRLNEFHKAVSDKMWELDPIELKPYESPHQAALRGLIKDD